MAQPGLDRKMDWIAFVLWDVVSVRWLASKWRSENIFVECRATDIWYFLSSSLPSRFGQRDPLLFGRNPSILEQIENGHLHCDSHLSSACRDFRRLSTTWVLFITSNDDSVSSLRQRLQSVIHFIHNVFTFVHFNHEWRLSSLVAATFLQSSLHNLDSRRVGIGIGHCLSNLPFQSGGLSGWVLCFCLDTEGSWWTILSAHASTDSNLIGISSNYTCNTSSTVLLRFRCLWHFFLETCISRITCTMDN